MREMKQVKADLESALSLVADDYFREFGFQRRKGSFEYVHQDDDITHTILFGADFFPKYEKGAEICVLPVLRVAMPTVSEMALRLVDGNKILLANAPDLIVAQPLEFAAPKEVHERWFATGEEEIKLCVQRIVPFVESWGLPIVKALSSPQDLVVACTEDDERLLKQKHWYIYVAAALALEGEYESACSLLEEKYAPGIRRRYAAVFENLRSMK